MKTGLVSAILIASFLAGAPALSFAAQCRDSHGKFIKCPPASSSASSSSSASASGGKTQCRDAKGKFIKCPASKGPCRDPKTGRFIKCK